MTALNLAGLLGIQLLCFAGIFLFYRGLAGRGFETWMSFSFLTFIAVIGLYVYDFLRMPGYMRWYFITPDEYSILLLLSGIFVLCVMAGEYAGRRMVARKKVHVEKPRLYLQIAALLFFVGAVGMAVFISQSGGFLAKYSATHGASANFTTAYIYRLPLSLFTAIFILMIHRLSGRSISRTLKLLMVFGAVFLFFDAFTQGKRGNTIRFVLLILVPFYVYGYLTRARQLPALLLLGTAMVLLNFLPYLRQATSLSTLGNFTEVVRNLPELSDKTGREMRVYLEGKHVIFAANTLSGAMERYDPNYGVRWTFPIVNLIPRAVWADKPSRYDMGTTTYQVFDSTEDFFIPSGSHTGGMVESFIEWGLFVVFFWFFFGFIGGYLLKHVRQYRGYFLSVMLFGYYSFYVQFLLQDTVAGLLFWIFTVGPFLVFCGLSALLPRSRAASACLTHAD
ncbi:hypothetical protein [Pseudohaliea sp.]|uniref:hypothetical protein n=1 Tax=Pseudohaliea sp. TaxID=2740289 RepID=UPI0032EE5FFF